MKCPLVGYTDHSQNSLKPRAPQWTIGQKLGSKAAFTGSKSPGPSTYDVKSFNQHGKYCPIALSIPIKFKSLSTHSEPLIFDCIQLMNVEQILLPSRRRQDARTDIQRNRCRSVQMEIWAKVHNAFLAEDRQHSRRSRASDLWAYFAPSVQTKSSSFYDSTERQTFENIANAWTKVRCWWGSFEDNANFASIHSQMAKSG